MCVHKTPYQIIVIVLHVSSDAYDIISCKVPIPIVDRCIFEVGKTM